MEVMARDSVVAVRVSLGLTPEGHDTVDMGVLVDSDEFGSGSRRRLGNEMFA